MTDEDIYRYYLGDVIVGEMYNSPVPYRRDDVPSFGLYEADDGIIRWKDFGLPDQCGNKALNLVQHLKCLPLDKSGYFEAARLVEMEVTPGISGKGLKQSLRRKKKLTPYIKGGIDYRPFEIEYWKRFSIDTAMLKEHKIEGLRFIGWDGVEGESNIFSEKEDPAFIYWFNKDNASWKLYRPKAGKRDKFRTNNISGVIEGWNQLQSYGDILLVASSTKDRLVLKKALPSNKVGVINPSAEGVKRDIVNAKEELKQRFKHQVILYDADTVGYQGAKSLARYTDFHTVDMRGKLGKEKDFSDFVDTQRGSKSYEELRSILQSILTFREVSI